MRYLFSFFGLMSLIPMYMFKKAFETNLLYQQVIHESFDHKPSFRLFFISDIHRRKVSKKLVEKVGTNMDVVIIGGDLADKRVNKQRLEANLLQLAKIAPILYVWGNNDREVGEQVIREKIAKVNGQIIENSSLLVRDGVPKIQLVGIDDVSSGKADIKRAFGNMQNEDYVIFVSHTPSVFSKVVELYHPNLLLAGHTHGGQIRLGKYGLYPVGKFEAATNPVSLISNGYGTSLIPFRLGASPECHIITISGKFCTEDK
ncbi:MAG: metallophosphoesterase [Paenisporosarcina sp.]